MSASFSMKAWAMEIDKAADLADRLGLAAKIIKDVDDASYARNAPRFSWRVKPSDLGDDCVAKLWYAFRWAKLQSYSGRLSRLFKRGHEAEAELTTYLRATGWEVRDYAKRLMYHPQTDSYDAWDWERRPDAQDQYEMTLEDVSEDKAHIARALARDKWVLPQWRVKDFGGHLSGYLDGIARHSILTGGDWILLEYKTYNTKRFSELTRKTVKITDPKYHGQCVVYLKYRPDLKWCMFLAINKNDDDLYVEIITRDDVRAAELIKIADAVVNSPVRPARLSQNPTHFKCKDCTFVDQCHYNEAPAFNCRSCVNAVAIDGGKFGCKRWNATIPDEAAMKAGCAEWSPIK